MLLKGLVPGIVGAALLAFFDLPPDPATADFRAYRGLGYLVGLALAALFLAVLKDKPAKPWFDVIAVIAAGVGCYFSMIYYLGYRADVENHFFATAALFVVTNALLAFLLAYAIPVLTSLRKLVEGSDGKGASEDKPQGGT